MLARLNHPNIVTVHDFGQANGFFYLLMEFVDGVNLRQAMKVGRFTPAQALAIVPKICEALQFAHNEGILHRDIKPENILLDSRGRVKIADFGIAKLLGGEAGRAGSPLRDAAAPSEGGAHGVMRPAAALTETGNALGTPQYMAPEQIEHPQDVDHRADIYSLGVVFYEMLTGELPIGRFAPPSQKSTVDPRMDKVVLRALEKERERRTQSAEEVKTQVETVTGASPAVRNPGTTLPVRALAYIALGLFLAATLGTLGPLALSPREDVILVFGGAALMLSTAFAAKSRTERLAKLVLKADIAIVAILGILLAISISVWAIRRAGARAKSAQVMELEKEQVRELRTKAREKQNAGSTVTYTTSPVTRGDLSRVVNAAGTLGPVAGSSAKWQIDAMVAEEDISSVEVGQNARFTMDAFPRQSFTGMVLQVTNVPTTVQNVVAYGVAVEVSDADPKFRPGMTANIAFVVAHRADVLRVPNAVLRFHMPEGSPGVSGGPPTAKTGAQSERTVWVLRGNEDRNPEAVTIQTGISDGAFTEVMDGLKEGDRVIIGRSSPQAPEPQSAFGPVLERVLHYQRNGQGHDALRLADGEIAQLPMDFFERGDQVNRAWLTDGGSEVFPGFTVFGDSAPLASWGLASADVKFALVANDDWNTLSLAGIRDELAKGEAPMRPYPVQGGVLRCLPTPLKLPVTLAFQAGDGAMGLVQILDVEDTGKPGDAPLGMKLRYKLMQKLTTH